MPPKKRSNKKKQKQPKKKQQNENKGQPPACTDLEPVAGPSSDQPPSDSESKPVAGSSSRQPPSYTVFEGAARPSSGQPPSYTVFEGASRPSSGQLPSYTVFEGAARPSSGKPPSKTVLKGVAGPSSGQPSSNRVVEPITGPSSSQLPSYTVYEGAARSSIKKLPPYTVFELVARPPPGQPPSYRILDQIAGPSSGQPSSFRILDPIAGPSSGQSSSYRVLDPIAGPSSGQPPSYRVLDPIAGPSSGQPPSYRVVEPIAGPSSGQPPSYRVLEPVAGPSSGQPPSFNVLGVAGPSSRPHSVSWVPGQTPTWRPLSPEPRPVPRLPEPLVVQVPSTVRPRVPGQSIPLPYPTPAPYTIPILPESGWSIVTPEPEDRLRVQLNTNLYFRDNLYTVHSFRQGEVVPDSPNLDSLSTGWILAQAMLLKDVMNQCRSLCFKLTQRVQLPSNYRGFPLLQIERIRMLSRMRFRYLMDVFRERINAEINGIPTVDDTTERCKLVISSISWIPVERQADDYTYFCLVQCDHIMYSTHTSATRFGIFQFFGPYIFPHLSNNFVIHFRFYRHANLRCIFPAHPMFGEASLNRDEVEQGKITLFCYDDTIGRDGFNIYYDQTLTENIAIPLPLSEWDSDSSDSDSD